MKNEATRETTLNKDKPPEYVIAEFATANWEKNTHTTTSAKFLSLIFSNNGSHIASIECPDKASMMEVTVD